MSPAQQAAIFQDALSALIANLPPVTNHRGKVVPPTINVTLDRALVKQVAKELETLSNYSHKAFPNLTELSRQLNNVMSELGRAAP